MKKAPDSTARFRESLVPVAERFRLPGPVATVEALGNGNVNDTYRVRLGAGAEGSVVLQRLNTQVFRHPELVMGNLLVFSEHVERRLRQGCPALASRRWEVPRPYPARDSPNHWVEIDGAFWRVISFIEASRSFDTITNLAQAREVGYGLGMFHTLISDLPVSELADTLAGFHVTPGYLAHYRRVLDTHPLPAGDTVAYCREFVQARCGLASVLEDARAAGRLQLRPIHGDPKINNVMMDVHTNQAIGLVDLDTVKPGLVQYDIGDCLRSGCNPLGEDTPDWQAVRFDTDCCEAILRGYGSVARAFLTDADYHHIYVAIRLIAFELGLRFFTDHLAGSPYFKTRYPAHNLDRALVQFRLTESIEAQESTIRSIIERMQGAP